ncbi:hypothetical protein RhiirA1_1852 [Rhizophagus irregularis]|uniref:Uncharacterized protein n=1 Tax=Rhizophagus irregularis TaxID=588596 RepID=A0A2I1EA41_9GLOM|nr:hypothetical protein RhiirA1_1852 [Rhizophagus irregularis]PKK67809.1 hypothetical protein RhiirC2_560014 [Rhizophagus irregularis]PKY18988.1 hypothetical protein RhiirB3_120645 [Rhizophagus irregularis]
MFGQLLFRYQLLFVYFSCYDLICIYICCKLVDTSCYSFLSLIIILLIILLLYIPVFISENSTLLNVLLVLSTIVCIYIYILI